MLVLAALLLLGIRVEAARTLSPAGKRFSDAAQIKPNTWAVQERNNTFVVVPDTGATPGVSGPSLSVILLFLSGTTAL